MQRLSTIKIQYKQKWSSPGRNWPLILQKSCQRRHVHKDSKTSGGNWPDSLVSLYLVIILLQSLQTAGMVFLQFQQAHLHPFYPASSIELMGCWVLTCHQFTVFLQIPISQGKQEDIACMFCSCNLNRNRNTIFVPCFFVLSLCCADYTLDGVSLFCC